MKNFIMLFIALVAVIAAKADNEVYYDFHHKGAEVYYSNKSVINVPKEAYIEKYDSTFAVTTVIIYYTDLYEEPSVKKIYVPKNVVYGGISSFRTGGDCTLYIDTLIMEGYVGFNIHSGKVHIKKLYALSYPSLEETYNNLDRLIVDRIIVSDEFVNDAKMMCPHLNIVSLSDEENSTTSIKSIDAPTHSTMYSLDDRKVNNNYKGIVIINGKKYINK